MKKVGLDGTGAVTRSNSLLVGAAMGGTGDWHYEINPLTFRGLISNGSGVIKSYGITDDISNPAVGIVVGTMPVNLSNFATFDLGSAMLGTAGKRHQDFSFGQDIIFLDASAPSSLKRLTNTNGQKGRLTGVD
jgi:hypothetical protein